MLESLGFTPKDWDVLLVGDGSGSTWDRPAGWACVSVERATGERRLWQGAVTNGTVNFGEIMAYVQPLTWLMTRETDAGRKPSHRPMKVLILTDSEYCRTQGESADVFRRRNAVLWSIFDVVKSHGISLRWKWIPRLSVALNVVADNEAGRARKEIGFCKKPADYEDALASVNPAGGGG